MFLKRLAIKIYVKWFLVKRACFEYVHLYALIIANKLQIPFIYGFICGFTTTIYKRFFKKEK